MLRRASLKLARGESAAILGKSGSGKTTLLNLISGIDQADEGAIWLNGQNLTIMNDLQRTLAATRMKPERDSEMVDKSPLMAETDADLLISGTERRQQRPKDTNSKMKTTEKRRKSTQTRTWCWYII